MTSVHQQEDIRIFHKECVSLADFGYEVFQVSCGNSYTKNGVKLRGVGTAPLNRVERILFTTAKVYREGVKIDADVYHFHDPELLPYGLLLKKKGKKVIFDSHEDIPAQIMDKEWIPHAIRILVARGYKAFESFVVRHLDAVVVATPHIAEKFTDRANKVVVINNYPKLDDITFCKTDFDKRDAIVCYAGGINELRGEKIMIEAMTMVDGNLIIAGDHNIEKKGNVEYVGRLDRTDVNKLYSKSVLGLCLLKPIDNYYYSQPIKIYEYMAAGIPFVCSDFPGWKDMVFKSGAGICVNPQNMKEVVTAINKLLVDRKLSQKMGEKGYSYVTEFFNWEKEKSKLNALYNSI